MSYKLEEIHVKLLFLGGVIHCVLKVIIYRLGLGRGYPEGIGPSDS